MKYASKYLRDGEQKKWLNLATSIGSNDQWVARECREFAKFINTGLDEVQRTEFAAITGITVPVDLEYPIDSKAKLQALLLKHFVDGISLSMIKEARPGIGGEVTQIYLVLAAELFADGRYPDDIYAHTAYRRRGTPATWLTVSAEFSAQQIEEALRDKIGSIIGSLNYYLGHLGSRAG